MICSVCIKQILQLVKQQVILFAFAFVVVGINNKQQITCQSQFPWLQIYCTMSQIQRQEQTNIFDIADKLYEQRSPSEHAILTNFIYNLFSVISDKMAKLLTFYLQKIEGPAILTTKEFGSQSFVVTGRHSDMDLQNPESQYKTFNLSKDKKVTVQQGQLALVLDYSHYLNCQNLGQSSIQEQINFLHSSEFLCSIPKRRLYYLVRKSTIMKFSFNQVIYHQGQQIQQGESGSGVYLVRKGDFGYFKQSQKQTKQIQTLGFSKGHLFGTLEYMNGPNKANKMERKLTVKCKSHSGLIYRISQDIFHTQIKPYCQNIINIKQNKLFKYLDNQMQKMAKVRQPNGHLLSHTLTRGFSTANSNMPKLDSSQFPLLTRTRLSIPNVQTTVSIKPLLSERIQQQGLRKTNYLSLTKQGPLKNYPMISQRSNFTDSEFRQFTRLERNKQMCQRVKQLKTNGKCTAAKGEILFSFFKQTWNFDKEKKMMLLNRRYA